MRINCSKRQAVLSANKARLVGSGIKENRQEFQTRPTLGELSFLLRVIIDELVAYRLWPVSTRLGHSPIVCMTKRTLLCRKTAGSSAR